MAGASVGAQIYTKKPEPRKATFVICQECFWCASCFRADDDFRTCPSCKSEAIDSLPIFESEHYKVGFSAKGGIELAFADARRAQ